MIFFFIFPYYLTFHFDLAIIDSEHYCPYFQCEKGEKMMKVTEIVEEYEDYYFHVVDGDRSCYYFVGQDTLNQYPEYPINGRYVHGSRWEPVSEEECLINASKILVDEGVNILALPKIEDASIPTQKLYAMMFESANNMVFIELDDELFFEELGLTKEETDRLLKEDIKKFHLENVIEIGSEEAIYTCYGCLQSSFTMKVGTALATN